MSDKDDLVMFNFRTSENLRDRVKKAALFDKLSVQEIAGKALTKWLDDNYPDNYPRVGDKSLSDKVVVTKDNVDSLFDLAEVHFGGYRDKEIKALSYAGIEFKLYDSTIDADVEPDDRPVDIHVKYHKYRNSDNLVVDADDTSGDDLEYATVYDESGEFGDSRRSTIAMIDDIDFSDRLMFKNIGAFTRMFAKICDELAREGVTYIMFRRNYQLKGFSKADIETFDWSMSDIDDKTPWLSNLSYVAYKQGTYSSDNAISVVTCVDNDVW